MDWLVISLRVVHVLGGVMWAGAAIFMALWFEPSVREAGPAGAPVMAGLEKHRYFIIMPIIAVLTLLSGGALFWKSSAHLNPAWMGSPVGIAYSLGGTAAVIAWIIGMAIMRPTSLKLGALGRLAATADTPDARMASMHAMEPLRRRIKLSVRWVGALVAVATITMAVARYLG